MNEFGSIMRRLREKKGETQTTIASVLNITPQMVSKLEMGKSKPSMDVLKKLSIHFDVTVEVLLGLKSEQENSGEIKMLPLLGEIAAGKPIFARENIMDEIPAIPGVNGDFYLRVRGKSMEPRIPDESMILVKKEASLKRGTIGVFIVDGMNSVIKRYYTDSFGVVLRSDNPAFDPIFFDRDRWESDCITLGRVVRVIIEV